VGDVRSQQGDNMKKEEGKITFAVIFGDGSKTALDAKGVAKLAATEKRKFEVKDSKGEVIFRKSYKG
jgi:hypothetical protein